MADNDRFRWRNGVYPPRATHWTSLGTFSIHGEHRQGSQWAVITFDGREIDIANDFYAAAQQLAAGLFDEKIGFPAASTRVPANVAEWNQL